MSFQMQQQTDSVKQKLSQIQSTYKTLQNQITENLKYFDDIVLDNKQTFQTLQRNLEDVKSIYQKDIDKFEQNVDKGITYNQSLFNRVQKDVNYLHSDQQMLRRKIVSLQKRVQEMENQVGNMSFGNRF